MLAETMRRMRPAPLTLYHPERFRRAQQGKQLASPDPPQGPILHGHAALSLAEDRSSLPIFFGRRAKAALATAGPLLQRELDFRFVNMRLVWWHVRLDIGPHPVALKTTRGPPTFTSELKPNHTANRKDHLPTNPGI